MKKNIITSLFILGLILGVTAIASAEMGSMMKADASVSADIRANIKTENERCKTLKNDTEVKGCQDKIRGKFPAIKDRAIFDGIFRGDGSVDDNNKNKGDEHRDGKVRGDFAVNFSARFEHVIAKLTAIHDRLSKVADRIEARMKKLGEQNVDTSVSAKFVAQAREELRLAGISTSDASASFKSESEAAATIDANNYKTVFAKTLANIKSTKEHLIQAHRDLVQAITNWKPGLNKEIKANGSIEVR